jgi:hypothetical protein
MRLASESMQSAGASVHGASDLRISNAGGSHGAHGSSNNLSALPIRTNSGVTFGASSNRSTPSRALQGGASSSTVASTHASAASKASSHARAALTGILKHTTIETEGANSAGVGGVNAASGITSHVAVPMQSSPSMIAAHAALEWAGSNQLRAPQSRLENPQQQQLSLGADSNSNSNGATAPTTTAVQPMGGASAVSEGVWATPAPPLSTAYSSTAGPPPVHMLSGRTGSSPLPQLSSYTSTSVLLFSGDGTDANGANSSVGASSTVALQGEAVQGVAPAVPPVRSKTQGEDVLVGALLLPGQPHASTSSTTAVQEPPVRASPRSTVRPGTTGTINIPGSFPMRPSNASGAGAAVQGSYMDRGSGARAPGVAVTMAGGPVAESVLHPSPSVLPGAVPGFRFISGPSAAAGAGLKAHSSSRGARNPCQADV